MSGELVRRLGLVGLVGEELGLVRRVGPVKRRRRGVTAGELLVSLAEAQLVGAECFDDIEDLRSDTAGARGARGRPDAVGCDRASARPPVPPLASAGRSSGR